MKIKKIQFLRPEIHLEFKNASFIDWLWFIFAKLPQLIKVKRTTLECLIKAPFPLCSENAGIVRKYKVWYICIPKIKVVKSG
jgi:hypothetical protein